MFLQGLATSATTEVLFFIILVGYIYFRTIEFLKRTNLQATQITSAQQSNKSSYTSKVGQKLWLLWNAHLSSFKKRNLHFYLSKSLYPEAPRKHPDMSRIKIKLR